MGKFTRIDTSIEGVYIIEPTVFGDNRGYFMETFSKPDFAEIGITNEFVQDNQSKSKKGVLRGLHFQKENTQEYRNHPNDTQKQKAGEKNMKELDASNFSAEINCELPVVVDFWAPWCGPCRSQTPILEQFAQKYDGKVKVCKVNTDTNPELANKFWIISIPTIMVFKGGEISARAVGVQSIDNLAKLAQL